MFSSKFSYVGVLTVLLFIMTCRKCTTVKLRQEDWCLQRYLFQEELDPSKPSEEKVLKSIIYGVTSSGNQAQRGLRLTAELSKDEFPEACEIVHKDTYMDDTMSGDHTIELVDQRADELEIMLSRGGFTLKGFTISGRHPDPALSADGISIHTAGLLWFSFEDEIALNIKDMNFANVVSSFFNSFCESLLAPFLSCDF